MLEIRTLTRSRR